MTRRRYVLWFYLCFVALTACKRLHGSRSDSARPVSGGTTGAAATATWMAPASFRRLGAVDSLTLERTACYGYCAAYRLRVSRAGLVQFISRDLGDSGRTARGIAAVRDVDEVLNFAESTAYVLELPDHIVPDSAMCGPWRTDSPTATVTLYMTDGTRKGVEDYYGCSWAPVSLRELEGLIDRVARVQQWLRPREARRSK